MTKVATATVDVKPIALTGDEWDCEMSGPIAADDGVFVPGNANFETTFRLVDGDDGTKLSFHESKPFCNQKKRCPPKAPGGNASHPFTVTPNGPQSITVRSAPVRGKGLSHFRLNFADGTSYDPIIIHE